MQKNKVRIFSLIGLGLLLVVAVETNVSAAKRQKRYNAPNGTNTIFIENVTEHARKYSITGVAPTNDVFSTEDSIENTDEWLSDTNEGRYSKHFRNGKIEDTTEHKIHFDKLPFAPQNLTSKGLHTRNKIVSNLARYRNTLVAVIVKNDPDIMKIAYAFMSSILRDHNIKIKFGLMIFNETSASKILRGTEFDKQELLFELSSRSEMNYYNAASQVGKKVPSNSGAYFAVLQAIQVLPKNSGILMFTDDKPNDETLAELATQWLYKNRLSLFVVWAGDVAAIHDEGRLLAQSAAHTGGNVFYAISERNLSEYNDIQRIKNDKLTSNKELVLLKRNLRGVTAYKFPLDYDIVGLHISYSARVFAAYLTTDHGFTMNIFDMKTVERFSNGSFFTFIPGKGAEVHLNVARVTITKTIGDWELISHGFDGYNVTVFAETGLGIRRTFNESQTSTRKHLNDEPKKQVLSFELKGGISQITNVTIIDKMGKTVQTPNKASMKYKITPIYKLGYDMKKEDNQKIELDTSGLPTEDFYLKVAGKNKRGDNFTRISYVDPQTVSPITTVPAITMEMSTTTNLIIRSQKRSIISFDVTNNRDESYYLYFQCKDDKSILQSLQPQQAWLTPKQTLSFDLTVFATKPGFVDLITCYAEGQRRADKSALLHVEDDVRDDHNRPELKYSYTSNCNEISRKSCNTGTWTLQVTAQDISSGLLRLGSDPPGLVFDKEYLAGTKEPVTAYYTASCCYPYLDIFAIDLKQNQQFYTTDANNANLSAGTIAAITIGVILFLVILICVGVCVQRKLSRQETSLVAAYQRYARE